MRAGPYAALVRRHGTDQPRPLSAVISYTGPERDPEQFVGDLFGLEADFVILVGPIDPRCGPLAAYRFSLSVDGYVRQLPTAHTTLTPLEAMLLRLLHTTNCEWATESIDDVVGMLKQDGAIDDEDAELLEQLLAEEQADRS